MIYLHIGSQKTGSSTIQHYLRGNHEALRSAGYNFVRAVRDWSDHNKLARELRGGSPTTPRLDAVVAEIRASDSPHHIISAEEMFMRRAVRRMAESFPADLLSQVRVIGYLRRPDDLMEALYKQRIKSAETDIGPSKFLKANWFECDYRTFLDGYADVFGREAMTIRPYRRDLLVNNDIVDDFMAAMGTPELASLPREMPQDNPTFSASLSRLMGIYVSSGALNFVRMNEILARLTEQHTRRSGDVFSIEERRDIFRRLADDLDYIAQTYGKHLAPVLSPPDFDNLGDKGYPTPREWAKLHRASGEVMVKAMAEIERQKRGA